jgi:hypothetical protein
LSFLLALAVSGCHGDKETEAETPSGKPADYFPTSPGTRWTYEITIGETEPLNCQVVTWPMGEISASYVTRGLFLPLLEEQPPETFRLVLSVKGAAPKQGPLEYPNGVELTIEEDELGIFEDVDRLFWAITGGRSGRFMVTEVATYPPTTPGAPTGAWGAWGTEDGYAMRVFFFADEPGIGVGMGEEPIERLYFIGLDGPHLHFEREVAASEIEEGKDPSVLDKLDKAFTEETWFEKGKGLVRLEQKVEGKTSMVWKLVEFSKG